MISISNIKEISIKDLTKEECLKLADNLVISWILKEINNHKNIKKKRLTTKDKFHMIKKVGG